MQFLWRGSIEALKFGRWSTNGFNQQGPQSFLTKPGASRPLNGPIPKSPFFPPRLPPSFFCPFGVCVTSGLGSAHIVTPNAESHISRGRYRMRQLGGFSVVVVIVAGFVPTVCPVGGGYMGYIRKALETGYLEHTRSACCTDDMFAIFVRFGRPRFPLLPLFVNRQLPCLHSNLHHALLLPRMHHRSLWCTKERAPGV